MLNETGDLANYGQYFKYRNQCNTCYTWKPPGSSHCQWCDHCVVLFDHCCQWISCIGIRNYFYYLMSLVFTVIYCYLLAVLNVVTIVFVFTKKYSNPYFN